MKKMNRWKVKKLINKDLIELQKGCSATCAVIKTSDYKELENSIVVDANITYNELIRTIKEKISLISDLEYFIIKGIDNIEFKAQEKFINIIKDRSDFNVKIPNDVIIVLTVENEKSLTKILKELYHFCTVAF